MGYRLIAVVSIVASDHRKQKYKNIVSSRYDDYLADSKCWNLITYVSSTSPSAGACSVVRS